MMQSLAEWRLGRVTSETKKNKQRVNLEPPRPMAARLKKQRVNLEPPRPMAARLKKQEDLLDLTTALFKLALQSHRSADYSSITVDTTTLDQHKLFLLVIFVP